MGNKVGWGILATGWIAAGKMQPIDPRHLFIMLWSATQFYADFEPLAADALGKTKLRMADYETATQTINNAVLRGGFDHCA
jgi:hypothetical protein